MNKIIDLNFNRKDIEEILLSNNLGNYFKNEVVKDSFPSMIFFTVILAIIIIFDVLDDVFFFWYIAVIPFWLYNTISYIYNARKIYIYKSSIKQWLDYTSSFSKFCIELTDNSISVVMDDQKTIQTWASIKYCKINEQRTILQGEEQFYLPSKSMTSEEYKLLREFTESKIKNDEL